jgi:glycerol uptake facilitator-like aquaporin
MSDRPFNVLFLCTGNIEKERAFTAFKYLKSRISVFISLPIRSLDIDGPGGEASGHWSSRRSDVVSGALARRLAAEALGTGFLVATVVGSGIMAETLTKDTGLVLLGNTLTTGAILVVLITIFGPISGAHFNPAVSLVFALKRDLRPQETGLYMLAQIIGGIAGTFAAHLMFGLPVLETSLKVRTGGAQWFAEWVATFGLVVTILAGLRFARSSVPWLVGLYITAAYWFTASTSFANPAVAIARSLTNTFSGIRPVDLPGFVVAQLLGSVCGLWLASWLLSDAGADDAISPEAQL